MSMANRPNIPDPSSFAGTSGEKIYARMRINPDAWIKDPNTGQDIRLVDFIGTYIPIRGFHSLTKDELEKKPLDEIFTLAQWPRNLIDAIKKINNSPGRSNAFANKFEMARVFQGFDKLSEGLVKESMKLDMTQTINKTLSHMYAGTDIGFSVKPLTLTVNWDDTIKVDPRANRANLLTQSRTEFDEFGHIDFARKTITLHPVIANARVQDVDFDKKSGVHVTLYHLDEHGERMGVIDNMFLDTKWPYHTNQVGTRIDRQYNPNAKWAKMKTPSLKNLAEEQVKMSKVMNIGTPEGQDFFRARIKASLTEELVGQVTAKEYTRDRLRTESLIREMPKLLSQHVDGMSEAKAAEMWNRLDPHQKALFIWKTEDRIAKGRQLRLSETSIKGAAGKEVEFASDELRAVLLHSIAMERGDQVKMFPNSMSRYGSEAASEALRHVLFSDDAGFGKMMGAEPQNFRNSIPMGIIKPKPTPVPRIMFDGSGKITTTKGTRSSILDALMTPDEHGKSLLLAQKVEYPFDPVTGMKLHDQYGYIISANTYDKETGKLVPKPLVGTEKGGLEDVVYLPTILERDGTVVDPLAWLGEEVERTVQTDPKFAWIKENGIGELSGRFSLDGLLDPQNNKSIRELAEANGTTVEHIKLLAIGRSEHDIQKLRSFKTKLDFTKFGGEQQIRTLLQEKLGIGTQTRMMRSDGEFFPTSREQIQELSKVMIIDRRMTGGDPADIAEDLLKIHAFTPMTAVAKLKKDDPEHRLIKLMRATPGSMLEVIGTDNAYADTKRGIKAAATLPDAKPFKGKKTMALIDFEALDKTGYGNPDLLQPTGPSEGFLAISENMQKEMWEIRQSIGRPVKREGMVIDREGNIRLQAHVLPGKMSYIKDGQTHEIDAALGVGEADAKKNIRLLKQIALQAGDAETYKQFEADGNVDAFIANMEKHKVQVTLEADGKNISVMTWVAQQELLTRMSDSDIADDVADNMFSGETAGRALMDKAFGLSQLTGVPHEEVAKTMWRAAEQSGMNLIDSPIDITDSSDPEVFSMAKKIYEARGLSVPSLSQQSVRENLEIVGKAMTENSAEMLGRQIAHSAVANGMGRAEAVEFFIKMLGM